MSHEEWKSLDDLDDVLIVQQIKKKDPSTITSNNGSFEAMHCLCHESGCDCERNFLVEVQEAIAKKQLQMLQADERGKQALKSEIIALKEKQEYRAELLRHRQRALDIEKERAQKIASLPPPLPKSVRLLLKKSEDEPILRKPDVQMPDELTTFTIKPIEICSKETENKENILNPEELEFKRKMQEEWDMKAKKRYYEALKKDRQKEEYSKILKQIQNAELFNRQEMAKNVSSADMKSVPCPISDKFQTAKKQVDMEDVAEKIFKRSGTKEHIIEDIEGYEDHYEEKYKKIDSKYETKMFDCVPSFVKDNYDYLLEDESKFHGGKNFSGLDDTNSDILNEAYIETSPGADELKGKEFDHVISHLDKLRSNLETEYEQNVKPRLIAATEIPKKELKDKAVETEFKQKPSEDKAVETETLTSPLNTSTFNFINAGVMAFKRRPRLPIMNTYENMYLSDMRQRDVHYVVPLVSESSNPRESWSPSTYCSLPSKHGIPNFLNQPESTKCDICIAEMNKNPIKDNFIQESTPMPVVCNKESNGKLNTSVKKPPLSQYVEKLAKKYLVTAKPTKNCMQNESSVPSSSDSSISNNSNTKTKNPAFEKETIGKSKIGIFSQSDRFESFSAMPVKNAPSEEETNIKMVDTESEMVRSEEFPDDDIHLKIKDKDLPKYVSEYSDDDCETKRIQGIHQMLSRKHPQSVLGNDDKSNENKNGKQANQFTFPIQNMISEPFIYHELSTIQEVDSAMNVSSLQLSQSKLSDTSRMMDGKQISPKKKLKDLVEPVKSEKLVSLLDSSNAKVIEHANEINFVPKTVKEINQNEKASVINITNFPNDRFVSSKEYLSTPIPTSGSYSSISTPSLTTGSYSSILSPILTTGSYSSISTPKFTPSLPPSSSTQSALSEGFGEKSIQKGIISGYISELETQDMTQSEVFYPKKDDDSVANLKLMTPQSNASSPSDLATGTLKKDSQDVNIAENFPPRPLFSNTSSQMPSVSTSDVHHLGKAPSVEFHDYALKKVPKHGDSVQSFKHMTPYSYLSSPSVQSFKHMTPHSYVSSPSDLATPALRKDFQGVNIGESLTHMPLFSSTSSQMPSVSTSDVHHLLQAPSVEFHDDALKKDPKDGDSVQSFKHMTPHSYVSSPSDLATPAFRSDFQGVNIAGSLTHMPLFSSTSSQIPSTSDVHHLGQAPPVEFHNHALKKDPKDADSIQSFKHMTPHSYVSTPSDLATRTLKKDFQDVNIAGSLTTMPLFSNASLPKLANLTLKESIQGGKNIANLKAPNSNTFSNITTTFFPFNHEDKGYTNISENFENFQQPTFYSNASFSPVIDLNVPVGDVNIFGKLKNKTFLENENKPVNLKFDNSTDSFILNSGKSKFFQTLPQINCNFTIKKHLKKLKNYSLTPKAFENRKYTGMSKNRNLKRCKHLSSAKKNAFICSSNFFVPSFLSKNTTFSNENISNSLITVSTSNTNDIKNSTAILDPQIIIADTIQKNKENLEKLAEENKFDSESTTSSKEISNEVLEKGSLILKSKRTNKTQAQLENRMNSRNQFSDVHGLSSTSSSTENLSVISRSKVVCQSTPIKTMAELLQEPGILEEPDFTLITTKLNSELDATELAKGPLTSTSDENQEKPCMAGSSQNECITPTSDSPKLASCDTPSLLSFMQHEMSSLESEKRVQSPKDDMVVQQNVQENKALALKEVKRSLFQKDAYKQRTERLYNNLEEVKKKRMAAERRKQMELNRMKAKQFGKTLTPKLKKN